jgi:[protein-PII] uridylyltransferase
MMTNSPPDGLICPAEAIFDHEAVSAAIADKIANATSERAIRAATVTALSAARKEGMAAIATAFRSQPFASRPTTRAYSWLTFYRRPHNTCTLCPTRPKASVFH